MKIFFKITGIGILSIFLISPVLLVHIIWFRPFTMALESGTHTIESHPFQK